MRAYTAIFASFVVSLALGSLGCANRGMHAPDDGGPGVAGSAGTAAARAERAGRAAAAARRAGGTGGGPTGVGGTGGQTSGAAGNCNVAATDAGCRGGACSTMFNFETGAQGAVINAGSTAFTSLMKSGTFTFCGAGALAINALFSGTSGPTTKGEVLINLPGAPRRPDRQDDHGACRRRSRAAAPTSICRWSSTRQVGPDLFLARRSRSARSRTCGRREPPR